MSLSKYHKINSVWKRDEKTGAFLDEFSLPEIEYLAPCRWDWSEKVDGTNIRVGWLTEARVVDGVAATSKVRRIGGRTDKAQLHVDLLENLEEKFSEDLLGETFGDRDVILYGEGIGPKIQKGGGRLSPAGPNFVLFDVKIGDWWLKREDVAGIALKLDVMVAPHVGSGSIAEAVEFVREGFSSLLPSAKSDTRAEGLVLRPALELAARNGSRIITKLKTKDFQK